MRSISSYILTHLFLLVGCIKKTTVNDYNLLETSSVLGYAAVLLLLPLSFIHNSWLKWIKLRKNFVRNTGWWRIAGLLVEIRIILKQSESSLSHSYYTCDGKVIFALNKPTSHLINNCNVCNEHFSLLEWWICCLSVFFCTTEEHLFPLFFDWEVWFHPQK